MKVNLSPFVLSNVFYLMLSIFSKVKQDKLYNWKWNDSKPNLAHLNFELQQYITTINNKKTSRLNMYYNFLLEMLAVFTIFLIICISLYYILLLYMYLCIPEVKVLYV